MGTVVVLLLMGSAALFPAPSAAQDSDDPVQMQVEAGYEGLYRSSFWLPLRVRVRNDGASFSGRVQVQPESSGLALSNGYSTPLEMPSGSEKVAYLYVQARGTARLAVELVDDEGVRIAERTVGLRPLNPYDELHAVVSGSGANNLALNDVAPGGYGAAQIRWRADQVPPHVQALLAIDTLIFFDVNTENMSVGQLQAVEEWVHLGGHLIVIGGVTGQATAAGLQNLLPFIPAGSRGADDLSALAEFAIAPQSAAHLRARSVISSGSLPDEARVLARTDDDAPLLTRWTVGSGTVDYLAVDPTLEPLRSWEALPELWFMMLASAEPVPGWTRGILDAQEAARAIAILPNVDLLPSALSMLGFIVGYVLLIGPLNYLVLSRLRRPGLAWITIPLFIIIFSGLTWTVGFTLRGSDVIVSRLRVVQSYPGSEVARQEQLMGIFSPRRETYEMRLPQGQFLQIMPGLRQTSLLQQNLPQSSTDIVQGSSFRAENLLIDGGIFANFSMLGSVQAPAIGGSITLSYTDSGQRVRGVLRNNSDFTLENPVLVLRNQYLILDEALAPGDVLDVDSRDFLLIREEANTVLPLPSPLESAPILDLGSEFRTRLATYASLESFRVLSGELLDDTSSDEDTVDQEQTRRNALLRSFVRDQYGTVGVGNRAYLFGWVSEPLPPDVQIEGVNYRSVDTTLHIVEVDVTVEEAPSSTTVTIQPDQFTWVFLERDLLNAFGGLHNLTLVSPGAAELRFLPLPGARLRQVDFMQVQLDRSSSYGRDVGVMLWNWEANEWELLENRARERYEIFEPQRFIGPNNVVDMRVELTHTVSGTAPSARIRELQITQEGRF